MRGDCLGTGIKVCLARTHFQYAENCHWENIYRFWMQSILVLAAHVAVVFLVSSESRVPQLEFGYLWLKS